jgi:hypothetical protein
MKKLLSLAFLAAIIGASVGCDDKKSTTPTKSGSGMPTPTGAATLTPAKT